MRYIWQKIFISDHNLAETKEWVDALRDVIEADNLDRALFFSEYVDRKTALDNHIITHWYRHTDV